MKVINKNAPLINRLNNLILFQSKTISVLNEKVNNEGYEKSIIARKQKSINKMSNAIHFLNSNPYKKYPIKFISRTFKFSYLLKI